MNIYINLAPYLHRVEDVDHLLARWNGGIELMMDGPNWSEPVSWDTEFKRFQHFTGSMTVHAPIWELNLASARYAAIRQYSYEAYKECLSWSAGIGARHVVIHPNLYSTPLFMREASQQYAKENLLKLGEEAHKLNIDLVVENMGIGEYALFNQEEFTQLFEEIPTVSALVDTGHAHANGWNIPELIRVLGDKLTAVHLHDNDGVHDLHQPIGQGSIDWEPIWTELRNLNHEFRPILEYSEGVSVELLVQHGAWVMDKIGK